MCGLQRNVLLGYAGFYNTDYLHFELVPMKAIRSKEGSVGFAAGDVPRGSGKIRSVRFHRYRRFARRGPFKRGLNGLWLVYY